MNTSYSLILQEVRRGLAETALTETDCTIDEIAAMLGYTETTNFRHAFRRWIGKSPHAYRLSVDFC
jgi:AraC-like DNA-binding protein